MRILVSEGFRFSGVPNLAIPARGPRSIMANAIAGESSRIDPPPAFGGRGSATCQGVEPTKACASC